MQAPLSPYLASLSPALLLSASIKQLKHSLLCKQRWIGRGFMELRVTECARRGRAGAAVRALLVCVKGPGSGLLRYLHLIIENHCSQQ